MKKSTKTVLAIALAMIILGSGLSAMAWAVSGGDIGVAVVPGRGITRSAFSRTGSERIQTDRMDLDAFDRISVDTDYGDVEFIPSNDGYRVEYATLRSYPDAEITVTDGELRVINTADITDIRDNILRGITGGNQFSKCYFRIYYPAGTELESVKVENGMGEIDARDMTVTGTLDLYADMGDITLERVWTQQATLHTAMGEIDAEGLTADYLDVIANMGDVDVENATLAGFDANLSMGDLSLSGDLTGTMTAENSMGSVEVELWGARSDYFLDLDTDMGETEVNDVKYRVGDAGNSNAPNHLTVSCSMGSIEVSFGR